MAVPGSNRDDALLTCETLEVTRHGSVAVVTLDRPGRLNAFTYQMRDDLHTALDLTDRRDDVRAVVLTGAGRVFCAGADLEEGGDTFLPEAGVEGVPPDSGGRAALRVFASRKPVIVAFNGPAAGVGVTMTLPADVRIASDDAKFAFVFTRRGLVPEGCSTWFLPRLVGITTSLAWTLPGRTVPVEEAKAGGLISEIVPKDKVLQRALAIAEDLAGEGAPVSVALTRELLWRGLASADPMQAHLAESEALFHRGSGPDVREGVAAFLEKRPANFPESVAEYFAAYSRAGGRD